MYLAVDIGGTKTLLGVFTDNGKLKETIRFKTPRDYSDFLSALQRHLRLLKTDDFKAVCVAAPGKINRKRGVAMDFGNLPWEDVSLQSDVEKIVHAPTRLENDANLAGLSEAKNIMKKYKKVLYVTISTGIGTGIITNGVIDPELADSEGGHMLLQHNGRLIAWEDFASGHAITEKYGKEARDIFDKTTWSEICRNFSVGIIDLIALIQPEVIVIGGGVGKHFDRFGDILIKQLKAIELPLAPVPPIIQAKRPEEAVLYGCYEFAKDKYGHVT